MHSEDLRRYIKELGANEDPAWKGLLDLQKQFEEMLPTSLRLRPRYFHRDGKPIVSDGLLDATIQWGLLFETSDRIVSRSATPYGEMLSTVWLGMEHGYREGRPLIFETMLFAPRQHDHLAWKLPPSDEELYHREKEDARIKRDFPHDQLQLRYTTEDEARESHEQLMLQCLVPPRWRHFLYWTIGRQPLWSFYEDEDADA